MLLKLGPFRIIEVSPNTLIIDKDGISNAVSIDRATLASSRIAKHRKEHLPNKPFDKRDDNVDTGKRHTTTNKLADALREFTFDRIVRHVGGGGNDVQYIVRWYDFTLAGDLGKPQKHISEHFITPNWH